jgi:hypothetical protein
MTVVSNTSPLRYLVAAGQADLLAKWSVTIRLDDAAMETDQAGAASLRCARHIGGFRAWKEHDPYQKSFERLLRDLKA